MKYIFVLILALTISACESIVEVNIPQENSKIVVNAFITPHESTIVSLSKSKSVLSNAPLTGLSGAEVVLLEDGQWMTALRDLSSNPDDPQRDVRRAFYFSGLPLSVGKMYTLQVDKAGFDPVEATTFIKLPIPIAGLQYDTTVREYSYRDYDNDTFKTIRQVGLSNVRLTIDDPAAENNYYEILADIHSTEDDRQSGSANGFVTGTDNVSISAARLSSNDPIIREGDFSNGSSRFYGRSLLFSDELFQGQSYTVRFNTEGLSSYTEDRIIGFTISLRTLSEAYYFYLRSADLQYDTEGNPYAEPVPVYNNIENGYGIFAGFNSDRVNIVLEE